MTEKDDHGAALLRLIEHLDTGGPAEKYFAARQHAEALIAERDAAIDRAVRAEGEDAALANEPPKGGE